MREVEPAAWDRVLAELGYADAYLRRAYVESASVLEPGRPVLLEHGGAVFACIVRQEPRDVVSPYGYGGPVGEKAAFWPAYERWCRETGVITTFVRFHPLFENHRGAPVAVEALAPTIGWRLDGDVLAGMHSKHRNAVRKAAAAGVAVRVSDGLGDFVRLYEETMRRAGAAPFYLFAPPYWQALERLGGALVRFDALSGSGDVVASALCLATPPWLHYHLGATAEAGRALGATTLLLYEGARWAQERGYERFHLGGGLGGRRDSLHEFKRRFDPGGELDAAIGKAVHDPGIYRALGADPDDLSGFFPAYRAPPT